MTTTCKRCTTDEDIAKASVFLLDRRYDLHPSISTMGMVELLYSYMTNGYFLQITDNDGKVIAASAYYHGTLEQDFKDKEIALIDIVIYDRAYRGTRLFVKGFRYMVNAIIDDHPEVQEVRIVALADNDYLCKMYAKLTTSSYEREGQIGKEMVFCVKIHHLRASLNRFHHV